MEEAKFSKIKGILGKMDRHLCVSSLTQKSGFWRGKSGYGVSTTQELYPRIDKGGGRERIHGNLSRKRHIYYTLAASDLFIACKCVISS